MVDGSFNAEAVSGMRPGSWITAILMASSLLIGSLVFGHGATARLDIWTAVTPWLQYRIIKENASVNITKSDIRTGYKDVDPGTILAVATNNPGGYVISLHCQDGGFFTAVEVRMGTDSYVVTPNSDLDIYHPHPAVKQDPESRASAGWNHEQSSEYDVNRLRYRFRLSRTAAATTYPWPIYLMVHPL